MNCDHFLDDNEFPFTSTFGKDLPFYQLQHHPVVEEGQKQQQSTVTMIKSREEEQDEISLQQQVEAAARENHLVEDLIRMCDTVAAANRSDSMQLTQPYEIESPDSYVAVPVSQSHLQPTIGASQSIAGSISVDLQCAIAYHDFYRSLMIQQNENTSTDNSHNHDYQEHNYHSDITISTDPSLNMPPPSTPTTNCSAAAATADKLEKLDQLRSCIINRYPEQYQRPFALYHYYQELVNGRSVQAAAYIAGLMISKSPQTIIKWRDDFAEFGNDYFSSILFSKTTRTKRTWLLEDYPELLKQAHDWVQHQMKESLETEGRLFRIIDFQKWVNTELINDLIAEERVSAISHSTARSWLHRFGYYDEQKKLEDDRFKIRQELMTATSCTGSPQVITSKLGEKRASEEMQDELMDMVDSEKSIIEVNRVTRSRSKTWTAPNRNGLGITFEE